MVSKVFSAIYGLLFLFFGFRFLGLADKELFSSSEAYTITAVLNFVLAGLSFWSIVSKKKERKPFSPAGLTFSTLLTAFTVSALIVFRNNLQEVLDIFYPELFEIILLQWIILISTSGIQEIVKFFACQNQSYTGGTTPIFKKKKQNSLRVVAIILACIVAAGLVGWLLATAIFSKEEAPTSPGDTPEQTTTTTQPRPTLPKAFVDKNTYSPYVVLYDMDSDQVLYSKGAEKKCYPASLTKLMTALVALDYTKPEDVFTLGSEVNMISPGSSRAYLTVGTKLTMEHLLQALLLPSGNDAAYAIAVQVGRIIEKNPDLDRYAAVSVFLKKMNAKAKELGCKKTNFENPDGYHDSNHYTTAKDMLYITRAAIKNDTIKAIVSAPQVTVRFLSGQSATWHNSNRLLAKDDIYSYEGAFGLKTGTTDEAGMCLAACATRDGRTTIAIVMGAESENGRWDDARGLLDLSFQ